MLEVNSVGKVFPTKRDKKRDLSAIDPREQGTGFHALRNVTFTLKEGCILGLLGANGAGKTTLMRVLATSLRPSTGTITLDGFDLVRDAAKVRRSIGFLSGSIGLYNNLNAEELLRFYGSLYGLAETEVESRIDTLLSELEIRDFAHRRIDNLSAGMKQRVAIARSLIHSPKFIIFDEPTTGLDVPTAQIVLDYIKICRDAGRSVIFSTHHMHEVEKLCDQVVLVHEGVSCFRGTIAQMKQKTNCVNIDDAYLALTGEGKSHGPQAQESKPTATVRTGTRDSL